LHFTQIKDIYLKSSTQGQSSILHVSGRSPQPQRKHSKQELGINCRLTNGVDKKYTIYKLNEGSNNMQVLENTWSPRTDLNRQPADYKSAALPLSYVGDLLKTLFTEYFFITFIKSNQIRGIHRSLKLKAQS
jgi:hypothetical protein